MIRDRDKNAARNMLIGAGLVPVADGAVSRLSTAKPKTQAPPRPRIPGFSRGEKSIAADSDYWSSLDQTHRQDGIDTLDTLTDWAKGEHH